MKVPVAGQVHDEREIELITQAARSGMWAEGPMADEFKRKIQDYIPTRQTILCNSGSSANLLAISAMTSEKLGDLRLKPGDKVITGAVSFPSTVAPILQNRLVPVYLDANLWTMNIMPEDIEQAFDTKPKPKAVFLTHTLGNPCQMDLIVDICDREKAWLIEDNCDALGSKFGEKRTGSFGHMSTQSFYPAHHISCGEGGAVNTHSPKLGKILESFRNWGRDCWCDPGKDNTCGKRFGHQFGDLPLGYDHKYTFVHLGYNLKMTDLQAAAGVAQMDKLEDFTQKRKYNHSYLRKGLEDLEAAGRFIIQFPERSAKPSWFGFLMTLTHQAFSRAMLTNYLEENGIATRAMFAGNILKQPAFAKQPGRTIGPMSNASMIMENSFWVGCWPGLTEEHLDYTIDHIRKFVRRF